MSSKSKVRAAALKAGYRSGLEEAVHAQLKGQASYEPFTITYTKPERAHRYTPDFVLPNGIIIETKGRFVTADRQKHLFIKACHPRLDIRFVFSNPNARIGPKSSTTYAAWSTSHGFQWAKGFVPQAWLLEEPVVDSVIPQLMKQKRSP
jgi:hypothetical protein